MDFCHAADFASRVNRSFLAHQAERFCPLGPCNKSWFCPVKSAAFSLRNETEAASLTGSIDLHPDSALRGGAEWSPESSARDNGMFDAKQRKIVCNGSCIFEGMKE